MDPPCDSGVKDGQQDTSAVHKADDLADVSGYSGQRQEMNCGKLSGKRRAREFDRLEAVYQARIAGLNGYTVIGMSGTRVPEQVILKDGEIRPSANFCN
jgi:hypothetical protein